MNRPKQVRIQGRVWPIKWKTEEQWYLDGDSEGAAASTDHESQEIVMRANGRISEDLLKENLLHEIMHAVIHTNRANEHIPLDDRESAEEYMCGTTAPLLRQVMRENRAVMTYLLS